MTTPEAHVGCFTQLWKQHHREVEEWRNSDSDLWFQQAKLALKINSALHTIQRAMDLIFAYSIYVEEQWSKTRGMWILIFFWPSFWGSTRNPDSTFQNQSLLRDTSLLTSAN